MGVFSLFLFVLTHYQIYYNAKDIPSSWDVLAANDVLLQKAYLQALEAASPYNFECYFIGVFSNNTMVGIALVQRVQLYLKDMFRDNKVSCIKTFFRDALSKVLKGNILVLGNLTHTGQHGLSFDVQEISIDQFYSEVFKGIEALKSKIKKDTNKTIRLILLKDFFLDDEMLNNSFFSAQKLHKASVQPNMIMNLREDWACNQDYVACMTKKYRDRYKRAKKKLNSIECKEMDVDTVRINTKLMHELYLNVSNNAKFNTFILPENHFYEYKLHLKDRFRVFGYYLKDQLVGFFTLIQNKDNLETYFLGYDIRHQYPNQLYLNMLYDMANFGIENHFKSVVYARTAMEIKSSVGAKPEAMVMYLKHTTPFLNGILKQVFRFMNPSKDWEERHPFK